MKIHADKIEAPPPHALNIPDVKRILAAVPLAWKEGLVSVRLSNSRRMAPASFSRYSSTLTICSRGISRKSMVTAILSELAAFSLDLPTRFGHRFSAAEVQRIHQLIDPLIERLHQSFHPEHTAFIVRAGRRIGFYTFRPTEEGFQLDHLYIHPHQQGLGAGSYVLRHLLAQADARRLPVFLGALRESASNRLYRRHGFVVRAEAEWDIYYIRQPES